MQIASFIQILSLCVFMLVTPTDTSFFLFSTHTLTLWLAKLGGAFVEIGGAVITKWAIGII